MGEHSLRPGRLWWRLAAAGVALAVALAWQAPGWRSAGGTRVLLARVGPQSPEVVRSFHLPRFARQFRVAFRNAGEGPVQASLRDPRGRLLCSAALEPGEHRNTFTVNDGFPAGTYTVRLQAGDRAPDCTVRVYALDRGGLPARPLLYSWLAVLLSGGVYLLLRLPPWGRRPARVAGLICGLLAFRAVVLLLYPLLHEGGHALAALAFGALDWSNTDLLGYHGNPYAGLRRVALLSPLQQAAIYAAGPVFPTLVAWISWALWRSGWGRHIREGRRALDVFWSALTGVMPIGHLGYVLAACRLAGADSDYTVMARGVGAWRLPADLLILAIAVPNLLLAFHLLRHAGRGLRALKGAPAGSGEQALAASMQGGQP